MKVNFVIRKAKLKKNGCIPIEMSICVKKQRKYVSTGREIKPSDFSVKTQKVKGNKELNDYLEAMKSRLYSIETTLLNKGVNVSIEAVLDVLRHGEEEHTMTILQLFELHLKNIKKRVERKLVSTTTLSKCEVSMNYMKQYIKNELNKEDVLLINIVPSFIESYYVFLLATMSNNTAIQKMKLLKRVLRFAVDEGFLKVSPFKMVLKAEKKEVSPLTVKEINLIKDKEIGIERLARIRDLFIFECYTGLAFSDLASLNSKDFYTDPSGNRWIIKKRHKTNVKASIPLLPVALDILEKYNYRLPRLSNVKYNAYLKELGDICGLTKSLHTHLARHTFATLLLNAGMNLVSVSKCLGHANSKITESTYAKVLPDHLFAEVNNVKDKLV